MTHERTHTLKAVSTYLASRAGVGDDLAKGLLSMITKAMEATSYCVLVERGGEVSAHQFPSELDRLAFLAAQKTGTGALYCVDLRANRFERVYQASPGEPAFTQAVALAKATPGWLGGPPRLMARIHDDQERAVLRTVTVDGHSYSLCVYSNRLDAVFGWEDSSGHVIALDVGNISDGAALEADLRTWVAARAIERQPA